MPLSLRPFPSATATSPVARATALAAVVLVLSACATTRQGGSTPFAQATLRTPAGVEVGTATFRQIDRGIHVDLDVHGIPDGLHGFHIHTVGRCDPPDFASAGGHLNPDAHKHGVKNPEGPHAGDLPNVIIRGGRSQGWTAGTLRVTNDGGPAGLFDADGSAVVLHALVDDEMTDPSGNSGARIACGVIQRR